MAEEKLDLLDLDDEIELPELPEEGALACGRPRRPWFLFGAALIVIVLATYIIVRIVMHGAKNDSVEIDLNTPPPPPAEQAAPQQPQPAATDFAAGADKVIAGQPAAVPVRVVQERKDVVFKPDAPSAPTKAVQKIEPPKPRPITKAARASAKTAAPSKAIVEKHEPIAATSNGFYVQFGSYATRSSAEVSQKKLQATHPSLFSGHNFVIQEALLPNGKTTYRLRIGFTNSQDADGFCRNAKSDGLDCYVAR